MKGIRYQNKLRIWFSNRRKDREPNNHSRVCSCHFRDGKKEAGPEIYSHNAEKLFESTYIPPKKTKKQATGTSTTVHEMVQNFIADCSEQGPSQQRPPTSEVILEAELHCARNELKEKDKALQYQRSHYSVSSLTEDVVRMETGLPTKEVFTIVVNHAARFKDSITYYAGWRVECITFEDQIFIVLMKLRQNYTNLHLAQLFSCSVGTISNIVTTFVSVLHTLLFDDLMATIPSRGKNALCSPSSFSQFSTCRIVIDCTDIEVATPSFMSHQSATYSTYRGMNSFKVLIGVAPNAVITFVSNLYPGSTSDKEIVRNSGLLNQMQSGDLILADKGFLIQDIVPKGVSVNIPPFLTHGKFTESEVKATRKIATCRIHVERANARLKDFKILTFVPPYLRSCAEKLIQLCAALVNLQFPLIKEGCEGTDFQ